MHLLLIGNTNMLIGNASVPAQANSEAQLGKFVGPHPVPGGGRILQALRFGGAGK